MAICVTRLNPIGDYSSVKLTAPTRGSGRGGVPLPETVVVVVFESYDHSYADRRQHIGGYAHTQTYSLPRGVWTARVGDNRDGENRRASVTICGEPF
jgi:hypothetical protein